MNKDELIKKIKLNNNLLHNLKIDISDLKHNISKYTNISDEEKIVTFAEKYGIIVFSRKERKSNDEIVIQISPFAEPRFLNDWKGNCKNIICIALIRNSSDRIETIYMNENGYFYNQDMNFIAESEDNFFNYLLTVEFDYHAYISQETILTLQKAGWFEERQIDIMELIYKFKNNNVFLSEFQINFIKQFGGLKGSDKYGHTFETYVEAENMKYKKCQMPQKNDLISYAPLNIIGYKEKIDFLLVGAFDDEITKLWLSSDGRMFSDQGTQLGRTIMEAWQTILSD